MSEEAQKKADERNSNRSRGSKDPAHLAYMAQGWGPLNSGETLQDEVAPYAAARRDAIAERFPGKTLVFYAGVAKQRANDTEYRFRPDSAFTHLTGWGRAAVAGSILEIRVDGNGEIESELLYLMPTAGHDSDEFFANNAIGEFWVGPRPTLEQVSQLLDIETRTLTDWAEPADALRLGTHGLQTLNGPSDNFELIEAAAELRLIKDDWEIRQIQQACDASAVGFANVLRELERAKAHPRGERVVETAFFAAARELGNDIGYETIAASGDHATTLHWIINDGPVRDGDLLLVDAGVEVDSLYTADITRTIPVNGKFSPLQRKIYEAVREAADAVFAMAKPGVTYAEMHDTAMAVIAAKTAEWGLLPDGITAEASIASKELWHRRWMVHGTGHMLGLDVHDCSAARRDTYQDAKLEPGMVFTIEPGLYFHKNDLTVPEEYRGIGVRIEDDVLMTEKGAVNLSAALPRSADDVEAWMAAARG
jgi:Xaa-Pro aminopeptidase